MNLSSASSRHPAGPPYRGGETTTITLYGASKAALERITTGLAAEVYEDGVAVNCVSPVAAVRTPGSEALVGELMKESSYSPRQAQLYQNVAAAISTPTAVRTAMT